MLRRISVAVAVAASATGCHAPPDRAYDTQWFFVRTTWTSSTVEVVALLHNSCDRLGSVNTIFAPKSVTFQVHGVDRGEACDGGHSERYLRIDLGEPLADRKITGSCSPMPCSPARGDGSRSSYSLSMAASCCIIPRSSLTTQCSMMRPPTTR